MNAFSVFINLLNDGRFVAEAVERVLPQNHAPAEVTVVDNGFADDTLRCWPTPPRPTIAGNE